MTVLIVLEYFKDDFFISLRIIILVRETSKSHYRHIFGGIDALTRYRDTASDHKCQF